MLAYRHAFHAGNHADVLKHLVLVASLRYLTSKPTPMALLDTHAGAGGYALDGRYAEQTGEAQAGIAKLWARAAKKGPLPEVLVDYLDVVRRFNPRGDLTQYPGSPALAMEVLRSQDTLALYEKHPTDERLLRGFVKGMPADRAQAKVHMSDGFDAPLRDLPPRARRGLVLIDPSYEIKSDYARTLGAVRECLRRFATGTIVVWYPRLQLLESRQLPRRLMSSAADAPKGWLHVTLSVGNATRNGFGMHGSGVVVLNPPHPLAQQLREAMPLLVETLGQSPDAAFTLDHGQGSALPSRKMQGPRVP